MPVAHTSSAAPGGTETSPTELLTADEVASMLRVSPGWVYEQTRRQRIPHLRLGRYVRFRRETIESWIAESETGNSPRSRR